MIRIKKWKQKQIYMLLLKFFPISIDYYCRFCYCDHYHKEFFFLNIHIQNYKNRMYFFPNLNSKNLEFSSNNFFFKNFLNMRSSSTTTTKKKQIMDRIKMFNHNQTWQILNSLKILKWIIIIWHFIHSLFFLHSLKWKQTSGMYHVCEFDYFFFKEKNQCIKCFTVYVPLINFKKKNSISIDSIWQLTMKWILYKCMVCVCWWSFCFYFGCFQCVCVCL